MSGVKGRSGGARPGAGRKRRDPQAAWLSGATAGPRPVQQASPPAAGLTGGLKPPTDLRGAALAVWKELAPFAVAEQTLTPATAMAFATLCKNIVILRKLELAPLTCAGP